MDDDPPLFQRGFLALLEIKDRDIRIMTLQQAQSAVDHGIHSGGAFSAIIPLVALYYGGIISADIECPTRPGQDLFVLSKGHAVAALASVYADLGYFDRSVLVNSRSFDSILKGHPGPLLPGVHVSTGPMGQGLSVAEGFALAATKDRPFDVFCLTGDGELQEGTVWEAVMYSGARGIDNLCAIVDNNGGQLDNPRELAFPMDRIHEQFAAFGWRVLPVDGTRYAPVLEALSSFKARPRDGRPTAIISHTRKGWGSFNDLLANHKIVLTDEVAVREIACQEEKRAAARAAFLAVLDAADAEGGGEGIRPRLESLARRMHLQISRSGTGTPEVRSVVGPVVLRPAEARSKRIRFDPARLPHPAKGELHSANSIVSAAMRVFAEDLRVVSIDADLATTSGLQAGVGAVDMRRAFNVGVAEANMMCIGEAFAALGCNAWVSTFCPFFNFNVLRRIAISHAERLDVMVSKGGWLAEGHGLDLTFLATASNFETQANGATHMGNDDITFFREIAHLKIVDLSCPNQLLGFMQWVMEGNQGLVYARVMRAPARVLYDPGCVFTYGRGSVLREDPRETVVIISSGRGVHEALAAAQLLNQQGIPVGVLDMPSVDPAMLLDYYDRGKALLFAEQNNGYLWSEFQKVLVRNRRPFDYRRLAAINTLDKEGRPRFIHSATYQQLLSHFGLSPSQLADAANTLLQGAAST